MIEDEKSQALEGKNEEPRVAREGRPGEQLALELIRGLLGRDEQQGRAVGRGGKRGADFSEAAKGLAAAGGSEEKARLHGNVLAQRRAEAKGVVTPDYTSTIFPGSGWKILILG